MSSRTNVWLTTPTWMIPGIATCLHHWPDNLGSYSVISNSSIVTPSILRTFCALKWFSTKVEWRCYSKHFRTDFTFFDFEPQSCIAWKIIWKLLRCLIPKGWEIHLNHQKQTFPSERYVFNYCNSIIAIRLFVAYWILNLPNLSM